MLEYQGQQKFNAESSSNVLDELLEIFRKRKSTRSFDPRINIDSEIILKAVAIAGTAPSGANKQGWNFSIVTKDCLKKEIRIWAESEEGKFYGGLAPDRWLKDLEPLHTDSDKAFLTEASVLIPVFFRNWESESKEKKKNYYAKESVGLATGFLIAALHLAGVSTLTYTPTNRNYLARLLNRPEGESTFMLIAAGLPSADAQVPVISKKSLSEISEVYQEVRSREVEEKLSHKNFKKWRNEK